MPAPVAFTLPSMPLPGMIVGAIFGYFLVLLTNPVRAHLRDGWRCVKRYPALWVVLGTLSFAYALFQLAVRIYFHHALPAGEGPAFVWARAAWRDPQLWLSGSPDSLWHLPAGAIREAVAQNVLPALESVAGIFNLLVATFPLSAFAAFLFLINWEGHHGVLASALHKRLGGWGWLLYAGIFVTALAALAKPLLYAAPLLFGFAPDAAASWFQWAPVAEWLSFLFEYLIGVCVQLCLILIAFCWVRGITFTHEHLIDFAIRRLSFVVRWALLVMVLSTLLIHLPLILKNFPAFQSIFPPAEPAFDLRWKIARALITVVLLAFATMQITLTFHSETLARALRDHWRFVTRNWWSLFWFFIMAGLHFYLLRVLVAVVQRGLGDSTALGVVWSLIVPWAQSYMAAWLLASWVCFFKSADIGRNPRLPPQAEQGVLF